MMAMSSAELGQLSAEQQFELAMARSRVQPPAPAPPPAPAARPAGDVPRPIEQRSAPPMTNAPPPLRLAATADEAIGVLRLCLSTVDSALRAPLCLVAICDESGSMAGSRLE
jgi:hypothetical protein